MTNRSLQQLFKLSVLTSVALLALSARADLQERNGHQQDQNRRDRDDDRRDRDGDRRDRDDDDDRQEHHRGLLRLPSGQLVTPMSIDGAVQQYLNPGLTAYPNFVAGMAVRSQLSPDGATLAIITAGQNSLYKPDGTVDVPNSTQYVFLYNVEGANKARPALTQVIKQVNAHVGLVFSPDGNTLYAAGGNDDAVYVYTKSGGSFTAATPIALGHFVPGATGAARNKGVGLSVQRSGWSRPCRFASWPGICRRAVCEEGRGREHPLQPGQRAPHDRGRFGHGAHQPEHRLPAADGRCL